MKVTGKWAMFADEEIHELTAEQVKEIHGGNIRQFRHCLRQYAANQGLRFSASVHGGKLKFRIWKASEAEAFLPSEVVARENGVNPPTQHAGCAHPKTAWARQKCREERQS